MMRVLLLLVLLSVPFRSLQAQGTVFLVDQEGNPARLTTLEQDFVLSRFARLDLATCNPEGLPSPPRQDYLRLEVPYDGQTLMLLVAPDVMRSNALVLYAETPTGFVEYLNCETAYLLPVLALMVTASFEDASRHSLLRQEVLARHAGLTSHEPNRLMGRYDSQDLSGTYMDFSVSLKHPVLPNAMPVSALYDSLTDAMEQFIPGQDEYYMQLYLAFSGRFSQYIRERASAPVLSRRFNPELFYRFWSSDDSWFDIGLGHESNGQRIDSPESFALASEAYEQGGEPAAFARDNLSRGWDYSTFAWQRNWNRKLLTELRLRHYLDHGPFQGNIEEYNTWEDGGTRNRPRHQYDGVTLDLQYRFRGSRCLQGGLPICFSRLQLRQETGYSQPLRHNSTTLELTTDFFGLPIQLWARSGYNSNLVDYYTYSNSWGIGIELLSR